MELRILAAYGLIIIALAIAIVGGAFARRAYLNNKNRGYDHRTQ